jgi:hypothetical protein
MKMGEFTPPVAAEYLKNILSKIDGMTEEESKKELKLICNFFSKIMESLPPSAFTVNFPNL